MSVRYAVGYFAILAVVAVPVVPAAAQSPPDKSGVKPSVISLPRGAGSIEGLGESFQPQLNTGGSTYGVSISVPPGRAGLAPSIRLAYNSFTGNGLAGIGWSLEFMSIKRQMDKGFPEYDAGDTFVFQGEELVPLTNAEHDWRCQNERGFQRLRQIDSDGDGVPDAWEVIEPNGTRHTLGRYRGQNNRWSVVEHPEKASAPPFDRTYQWLLDSTTDLNGNRIEYEYMQGTGVLYPSRITYSELSNNFHEVTFQYEARADAFDDYRPTFSAKLTARLKRIEVRTQGQLVRAYNFAYDYQPGDLTADEVALQSTYLDLGVTLLKRVVQVDRSGNDANYLPPLVFTYSGLDLTKAEQRTFAAAPDLDLADPNGRVQLADLDGDGLPDLFATTLEGATTVQRAALNRGESKLSGQPQLSFAPSKLVINSSAVDLAEPNTVVHDPKAKGLVDMSNLSDEGGDKRLSTFGNRAQLDVVDENRLGFSQDNLQETIIPSPPAFVTYSDAATRQMDVNFDKKSDFVNLEPGFGAMVVNTFYIDRTGTWVPAQTTLPPSYPLANTFQDASGNPNPCVHLADMNGDRMLDLICLAPTPSGTGQRISVSYWPLCGLGRYSEQRQMATTDPDTFDIGSADLRDVYVEDFTGDGLADVLVIDGSGPDTTLTLRVNIAGQRWSPPYVMHGLPRYAPRDPTSPTILRVADLDGNGSLDLLFRNTAPVDSWSYVELLPSGAPSLMIGIDNGLGKRTSIVYGSAAEDEQLAREGGHPWKTYAPIALQVVRQIRTTSGLDLNGDGQPDTMVSEFRYRDPYYDGYQHEFRGFAFAQRIDYGDDFLFDPVSGLMQVSTNWDTARTPTGQVSGPSLVTRYRFHTGAADQQDNDDYGGQPPPPDAKIDEFSIPGGREEEGLKGLERVVEQVDPVVLHSALDGDFDAGCEAAATATTPEGQDTLTPDQYVYNRVSKDWKLRRLYRPAEPIPYWADQNADGIPEDYTSTPAVPVPAGRFASQGINVLPGNGRSVTFAINIRQTTEVREANGLLSAALGYPQAPALTTTTTMDYDDYGNQTVLSEWGLDDPAYDDERITTTTYAQGGNALSLWVINKPDTISVTDENATFVSKKIYFYDGAPFVGLQSQIQDRALVSRTVEYIDASRSIQASRAQYDVYGNTVEIQDPNGNIRRMIYDPVFETYPISETMVVGGSSPDLTMEATYDYAFGVVTQSKDYNGNVTTYLYDSFARQVGSVRPGDSMNLPTVVYEYLACDPVRGQAFAYDKVGNLTVSAIPLGSANRVTTRQREISGQTGQYVTASFADGLGRSLATIEEGEATGTWVVKQATSYNLRGQPQSQWLPYQVSSADVPQFPALWPAGRPPASDGINPAIVSTDSYYDAQGREIFSSAPPESWGGARLRKATQYLPFRKLRFDEEDLRAGSPYFGTPHIDYMDGLGRLIAVEEVVGLSDTGQAGPLTTWRTEYGYDLNDRLTRIQDSQGNVKTITYDGLKRMTRVSDPDRGSLLITYDDASNIRQTTDAKGQTIAYTYDGVNRLKTEDYQNGGPQLFDVEYFYDTPQAGLDFGDGSTGTANNTKGQIAYIRDQSGETHFSYDARNRPEREVKRIRDPENGSLVSFSTQYGYDSADRLTALTYPDGDQVTQSYSPRNLLSAIHGDAVGDIIGPISYQSSAQLQAITYGNGVTTLYQYDPRLRMISQIATNRQSLHLVDFGYSFDGVSNLKGIEDRRNLAGQPEDVQRFNQQTFTYDSLYRLTQVGYAGLGGNGSHQVNYAYDRIGNLLSQNSDITDAVGTVPVVNLGQLDYGGTAGTTNRPGRGPSDPPGPHALSSIQHPTFGSRSFDYDANGNMTTLDRLSCTWDFKDRLVAAEDNTMRAEYTYDYSDRRIIKRIIYKPSPTNTASTVTTFYANKYFEVREHEQPTKYIFIQGKRVARVTGSLSMSARVQRLRVSPGWNLCSLAVGAPNGLQQLTASGILDAQAIFRWDPANQIWQPVPGTGTFGSGTILYLFAFTNGTLAVTGTYADPGDEPVPAGGSFHPGAGLEAWDLQPLLSAQPSTVAWEFDPAQQFWRFDATLLPANDPAGSEVLSPGGAFFTSASVPSQLSAPDPALRIRYYHHDHLGSSSVMTDAAGTLVQETEFYPFGDPRYEYRPAQLDEPYQFSQKERDRETGLHCFSARYLAGSVARFMSVDPKYSTPGFLSADELAAFTSQPQMINLYSYGLNNPITYVDPSGLSPWSWFRGNVWIPFVDPVSELDGGRTFRSGLAVAEMVGGALACGETGLGCAIAANGVDNFQAEAREGRTAKAAVVTGLTGSETAGKVAELAINVGLDAAEGAHYLVGKAPAGVSAADKLVIGLVGGGTRAAATEFPKIMSEQYSGSESPNSSESKSQSSSATATSSSPASTSSAAETPLTTAEEDENKVCYPQN